VSPTRKQSYPSVLSFPNFSLSLSLRVSVGSTIRISSDDKLSFIRNTVVHESVRRRRNDGDVPRRKKNIEVIQGGEIRFSKGAFHLMTQIDTNIILSFLTFNKKRK